MAYNRQTRDAGTYFLEATTAHTGLTISMLEINADAVFTTITITDSAGTTSNGLTSMNLTARTVTAGKIIACPSDSYISAVTMSSGSAIGIRK